MKNTDFFEIIENIDDSLLYIAFKAKEQKRAPRHIWLKVCAAACIALMIGSVAAVLPYIPTEYDLDYSYTDANKANISKKQDIWVYFVENSDIKRKRVKLPLSANNVFLCWKHLNNIGDDVRLIEYSVNDAIESDQRKSNTNGICLKKTDDRYTLSMVISEEITNYYEKTNPEKLITSLEKTMTECIEIKNDTITLPPESDEVEPTRSANNVLEYNGYQTFDYTDDQKAVLYNQAEEAVKNKEYQYAHSLFALLARHNYKDSGKRELSLVREANAIPIVSAKLATVIGGANCSIDSTPDNAGNIDGLLYIGEGGTPHFAYHDSNSILHDIIPDSTLKDVVSIVANSGNGETYYQQWDHLRSLIYFYCIKSNGEVALIYNPYILSSPMIHETWSKKLQDLESYCKTLKGVSKITTFVYESNTSAVFLHDNGSVSIYEPNLDSLSSEGKTAVKSMKERRDIVDVRLHNDYIWGLKADGSVVVCTIRTPKFGGNAGVFVSYDHNRTTLLYNLYDQAFDSGDFFATEAVNVSESNQYLDLERLLITPDSHVENDELFYHLHSIYRLASSRTEKTVIFDIHGQVLPMALTDEKCSPYPLSTDGIQLFSLVNGPNIDYITAISTEGKISYIKSQDQRFEDVLFESLFDSIEIYVK